MKQHTIGQLAKLTSNTVVTLRYYERLGLLPQVDRSEGGFRLYPNTIIPRLSFIKNAKSVGFSLKEIKELFELQSSQSNSQTIKTMTQAKIECIKDKITTLKTMRHALDQLNQACDGKVPISECPILENLYNKASK